MQNIVIASQEPQIVEMFQVEELEQRLENKWGDEESVGEDNISRPYCVVPTKCVF
jgi:hypothetical protein